MRRCKLCISFLAIVLLLTAIGVFIGCDTEQPVITESNQHPSLAPAAKVIAYNAQSQTFVEVAEVALENSPVLLSPDEFNCVVQILDRNLTTIYLCKEVTGDLLGDLYSLVVECACPSWLQLTTDIYYALEERATDTQGNLISGTTTFIWDSESLTASTGSFGIDSIMSFPCLIVSGSDMVRTVSEERLKEIIVDSAEGGGWQVPYIALGGGGQYTFAL